MNVRLGALAALLSAICTAPAHAAPPYEAINAAVVDRQIVPAYQVLGTATQALHRSAIQFCANPDHDGLTRLRTQVGETWEAWAAAQQTRFGPIEFLNRGVRFEFWPERRGETGRHLEALLSKADLADFEPDRFAQASVAIQGLPAIERLLFVEDREPVWFAASEGFRCRVVETIAGNLKRLANGVLEDWLGERTSFRERVLQPGPGNPFFPSSQTVTAAIVKDLSTALQFVAEIKLARSLGESPQTANPTRLEAWRSGLTGTLLTANIHSIALTLALIDESTPDLDLGPERARLAALFNTLSTVGRPLAKSITFDDDHRILTSLSNDLSVLRVDLTAALLSGLDLTLGFNSLDGD